MPFLDGKEVKAEEIDPGKHRFIGMFRHPIPPYSKGWDIACPCGQILKIVGEETEHWMRGHFDVPQYVTIATSKI